jgi:hypothetical protein
MTRAQESPVPRPTRRRNPVSPCPAGTGGQGETVSAGPVGEGVAAGRVRRSRRGSGGGEQGRHLRSSADGSGWVWVAGAVGADPVCVRGRVCPGPLGGAGDDPERDERGRPRVIGRAISRTKLSPTLPRMVRRSMRRPRYKMPSIPWGRSVSYQWSATSGSSVAGTGWIGGPSGPTVPSSSWRLSIHGSRQTSPCWGWARISNA